MIMNYTPLDSSFQCASFESSLFSFKRNSQKTKKLIFLSIWFYSATKNFRKKPFYIIFTSENHLNAHSSLVKQHMAMNFAPLDCPCQGASSESKKIYLDFFILEKIAKNQKIHIFGSHSKKWVQWPELLLYLNSTDPIQ
jgi:hypothetical protein